MDFDFSSDYGMETAKNVGESIAEVSYKTGMGQGFLNRLMENKNPVLLALANCFIGLPGFGHALLDSQPDKAWTILKIGFVIDIFVCIPGINAVAIPILMGLHLLAIVDVIVMACRMRGGKTLGKWEWFWNS